jgi:glyoxylase-like metal-dependent hydrolase (beta-lactamase superfamily II)
MITRVRLGEFEVFSFVENRMHLDGGAMFGVIPKKLWTREVSCDENNLIPLDLNLILIKAHGKNLLVDSGCGDVGSAREKKIYCLQDPTRIETALQACGVAVSDVDYVLLSHLHFDHSTGGLARDADGRVRTRFPNARYVVNELEWRDAQEPNERTAATYVPEYMGAYADSKQVDTVSGVEELLPGITLRHTGGHTRGHQAVIVASEGEALGYYADIIPTQAHLKTAWVAGVDTLPLDTLKVKKQILKTCVDDNIWLALDHDLQLKLASVAERDGQYTAEALSADRVEVVEP